MCRNSPQLDATITQAAPILQGEDLDASGPTQGARNTTAKISRVRARFISLARDVAYDDGETGTRVRPTSSARSTAAVAAVGPSPEGRWARPVARGAR